MNLNVAHGSTEPLLLEVFPPHDPTGDPVEIAVLAWGSTGTPTSWTAATWHTEAGRYWVLIPGTFVGTLPKGRYRVFARITDASDVPLKRATNLLIIV